MPLKVQVELQWKWFGSEYFCARITLSPFRPKLTCGFVARLHQIWLSLNKFVKIFI